MKTNLKLLLMVAVGGLLLTGCCTTQRVTQWEYKTLWRDTTINTVEPKLTELGLEGWELVSHDNGSFVFKRPKR